MAITSYRVQVPPAFHGFMPNGVRRTEYSFPASDMNSYQSADQLKQYYQNVLQEIMKGPDASRWLQAMQLNIDNNPIYQGITDGPNKQVQPEIPVDTALKMKAYIAYQLAIETLRAQQFLSQWYQYTDFDYDDVYAFGGVNKIGVPNVLNTYMYLAVPQSTNQVNAWLDKTATGNLSQRKWFYGLYGAELPDLVTDQIQGADFSAYNWNKEVFEWLFNQYVTYMRAHAPTISGRGGNQPGAGTNATVLPGKGVNMVTGRAGNAVDQVTGRTGNQGAASAMDQLESSGGRLLEKLGNWKWVILAAAVAGIAFFTFKTLRS